MIETLLEVKTAEGRMETFTCRPAHGGPRPLVLFLMDAPGIREELRDMARRFALAGFHVALPNLYYRFGVTELGPLPRRAEGPLIPRIVGLMNRLTIAGVMQDIDALFAAIPVGAVTGSAACIGYCMSGQFAMNAAARHPERIAVAASVHGTRLVTGSPDSPHRVASRTRARLYFACAEFDEEAPLSEVRELASALEQTATSAEVEIYPGVEHGFVFPGRDAYDLQAAERHWERLFGLLKTLE